MNIFRLRVATAVVSAGLVLASTTPAHAAEMYVDHGARECVEYYTTEDIPGLAASAILNAEVNGVPFAQARKDYEAAKAAQAALLPDGTRTVRYPKDPEQWSPEFAAELEHDKYVLFQVGSALQLPGLDRAQRATNSDPIPEDVLEWAREAEILRADLRNGCVVGLQMEVHFAPEPVALGGEGGAKTPAETMRPEKREGVLAKLLDLLRSVGQSVGAGR